MITTGDSGRTDQLLALMKRGDDAFNARDFAGMRAVHHPDMIAHVTGSAEAIRSQPAHAEAMKNMIAAFPDVRVHNDPYPVQFGSGNWITVVCRTTGTFTGEMTAPDGKIITATGRSFKLDFSTTAKWQGDLLVEEYVFWDSALQAQQLGLA